MVVFVEVNVGVLHSPLDDDSGDVFSFCIVDAVLGVLLNLGIAVEC